MNKRTKRLGESDVLCFFVFLANQGGQFLSESFRFRGLEFDEGISESEYILLLAQNVRTFSVKIGVSGCDAQTACLKCVRCFCSFR